MIEHLLVGLSRSLKAKHGDISEFDALKGDFFTPNEGGGGFSLADGTFGKVANEQWGTGGHSPEAPPSTWS